MVCWATADNLLAASAVAAGVDKDCSSWLTVRLLPVSLVLHRFLPQMLREDLRNTPCHKHASTATRPRHAGLIISVC